MNWSTVQIAPERNETKWLYSNLVARDKNDTGRQAPIHTVISPGTSVRICETGQAHIIGLDVGFIATGAKLFLAARRKIIEQVSQPGGVAVKDVISELKTCLGLPTKDIASILRVSRQSLYLYQRDVENENTINLQTRERAQHLYQIVRAVRGITSKSPGPLAKNIFDENGKSLFDLLTAEQLDADAIYRLAAELADRMDRTVKVRESDNNRLYQLTRTI